MTRDTRENNNLIRHVYKGIPGMTDLHTPGTVRYFTRITTAAGGPRRNGWIREDGSETSDKTQEKEIKQKRSYNKKPKQTKEKWN